MNPDPDGNYTFNYKALEMAGINPRECNSVAEALKRELPGCGIARSFLKQLRILSKITKDTQNIPEDIPDKVIQMVIDDEDMFLIDPFDQRVKKELIDIWVSEVKKASSKKERYSKPPECLLVAMLIVMDDVGFLDTGPGAVKTSEFISTFHEKAESIGLSSKGLGRSAMYDWIKEAREYHNLNKKE